MTVDIWCLGSTLAKVKVDQHNRIVLDLQNDFRPTPVRGLLAPMHARQLAETLINAADIAESFDKQAAGQQKTAIANRVGKWLAAALDDPSVCDEMKADVAAWFGAGEPDTPFQVSVMRKAVDLACALLIKHEPGDSRAVSDAFVALAAAAVDTVDDRVHDVIRDALARLTKGEADPRERLAKAIYEAWCPTETHRDFESFKRIYPEVTCYYEEADRIIGMVTHVSEITPPEPSQSPE